MKFSIIAMLACVAVVSAGWTDKNGRYHHGQRPSVGKAVVEAGASILVDIGSGVIKGGKIVAKTAQENPELVKQLATAALTGGKGRSNGGSSRRSGHRRRAVFDDEDVAQ
ncbi:hypothetical protein C8J56DRAFT_522905 [Mycena floridula]|nr:hypothetical protein C8J56DRAFT_522905 [Mycena floridula]